MYFQEKKQYAFLITWLVVFVSYLMFAINQYLQRGQQIVQDLPLWAGYMLWTFGISILAIILIQIIFRILLMVGQEVKKEIAKTALQHGTTIQVDELDMTENEDEMDKLIQAKANGVASLFSGFGFVLGLVLVRLGLSSGLMLNVFFLSSLLGLMASNIVSLYYYKKGFVHG